MGLPSITSQWLHIRVNQFQFTKQIVHALTWTALIGSNVFKMICRIIPNVWHHLHFLLWTVDITINHSNLGKSSFTCSRVTTQNYFSDSMDRKIFTAFHIFLEQCQNTIISSTHHRGLILRISDIHINAWYREQLLNNTKISSTTSDMKRCASILDKGKFTQSMTGENTHIIRKTVEDKHVQNMTFPDNINKYL